MQATTTTQTALKWGAIIGVITIIHSVIGFIFKLDPTQGTYKWIGMVIGIVVAIGGLILAMKDYKKEKKKKKSACYPLC